MGVRVAAWLTLACVAGCGYSYERLSAYGARALVENDVPVPYCRVDVVPVGPEGWPRYGLGVVRWDAPLGVSSGAYSVHQFVQSFKAGICRMGGGSVVVQVDGGRRVVQAVILEKASLERPRFTPLCPPEDFADGPRRSPKQARSAGPAAPRREPR
jgi:hypothetical protein